MNKRDNDDWGDDVGHDGYPHEQSCATCIWRGGYWEGPGRLGGGELQYCHEPHDKGENREPLTYVYEWMGCNRHHPYPKGMQPKEFWPDEGTEFDA